MTPLKHVHLLFQLKFLNSEVVLNLSFYLPYISLQLSHLPSFRVSTKCYSISRTEPTVCFLRGLAFSR